MEISDKNEERLPCGSRETYGGCDGEESSAPFVPSSAADARRHISAYNDSKMCATAGSSGWLWRTARAQRKQAALGAGWAALHALHGYATIRRPVRVECTTGSMGLRAAYAGMIRIACVGCCGRAALCAGAWRAAALRPFEPIERTTRKETDATTQAEAMLPQIPNMYLNGGAQHVQVRRVSSLIAVAFQGESSCRSL